MHTDISSVLVEEHRRRLRDAAQAPPPLLVTRLWAFVRRRKPTPQTVSLPQRELERLAA
jgi:hypothetical protein